MHPRRGLRRDARGVRRVQRGLRGLRLTPEIHLVASGSGGFDLTDPYDCHVYVLESRGEAALVDTGIGPGADAVLTNLESANVAPEALRYVVLSHAHPDHSGGTASLAERLPDARVLASAEVARFVGEGDEEAMSLEVGKRAEFYPPGYRFQPCPSVEVVEDGERLSVGSIDIEAISTPGHSAGHLSFLATGGAVDVCFSGDLVFVGGRISLEANWDCSLQDYAASVRRLSERDFEALLPGHHSISLARGRRHLDAAARQFERGFVPTSVV